MATWRIFALPQLNRFYHHKMNIVIKQKETLNQICQILLTSDMMKMAPIPTVMKQLTALSSWKHAILFSEFLGDFLGDFSKKKIVVLNFFIQFDHFRHNEDGSYSYGYEAADGSFKLETCYSFFRIFWRGFFGGIF